MVPVRSHVVYTVYTYARPKVTWSKLIILAGVLSWCLLCLVAQLSWARHRLSQWFGHAPQLCCLGASRPSLERQQGNHIYQTAFFATWKYFPTTCAGIFPNHCSWRSECDREQPWSVAWQHNGRLLWHYSKSTLQHSRATTLAASLGCKWILRSKQCRRCCTAHDRHHWIHNFQCAGVPVSGRWGTHVWE